MIPTPITYPDETMRKSQRREEIPADAIRCAVRIGKDARFGPFRTFNQCPLSSHSGRSAEGRQLMTLGVLGRHGPPAVAVAHQRAQGPFVFIQVNGTLAK